jgi:hypothetical protein
MFGSGDGRNSTTFVDILYLLVILFLAAIALTVLRMLVGLDQ